MFEKLNTGPESHEAPRQDDPERLLPTAEQAKPLRRGEQDPAKMLEEARDNVQEAEEAANNNPLEELQESERRPGRPAPAMSAVNCASPRWIASWYQ